MEVGEPAATRIPEIVEEVRQLERIIRRARADNRVQVVVEPCAVHNEQAWAGRLPGALTFLYGR